MQMMGDTPAGMSRNKNMDSASLIERLSRRK